MTNNRFFSGNLQIYTVKAMYFMAYVGFASWLSYFYVFLKDGNGFSGLQVGAIAAVQQISMVIIMPAWGLLADKFGRKRMLLLALLATVALFSGFYISKEFVYYLFFIVLFTSFYNPVTTLLDSINLDMIEQNPEVSYGELRLWASIGWATGTVVTGQFINSSNLHLIFAIAAVQLFLVACITFFLYKPLRVTKNIASLKLNTIKDLIFSDRRLTIFLGVLLAYGVFSAPIQMFINIYYSEIGAGYNQIGYAFAVQSLSELPFFFFGQRIVNRYGAKNVLIFTMVVTALRMVAYGFTANPWVAIAIGSSHGIGLALFLVAVVNYLHAYVPAHLRATGQSFVFAFYFGAGVSGGNMFTGWLKDLISIKTAMWLQGSLALSLAVLAVFILTNKHHKEEAETTVEMA